MASTQNKLRSYYFDTKDPLSSKHFSDALISLLSDNNPYNLPIVLFCIGTDRATGDCLGPIIGYKMKHYTNSLFHVYGTLSEPIHAKNLEEMIDKVYKIHDKCFVIAIDACLGKMEHIGKVHLGEGPLSPGSGVNKVLPEIGDIYITGIVNISGALDTLILQNTRLNTVMEMADFISFGIRTGLARMKYGKSLTPQEKKKADNYLVV